MYIGLTTKDGVLHDSAADPTGRNAKMKRSRLYLNVILFDFS